MAAVLAGIAWTVGSFVETGAPATYAALTEPGPEALVVPAVDEAEPLCTPPVRVEWVSEAYDCQTLTPVPSWCTSAGRIDDLLRAEREASALRVRTVKRTVGSGSACDGRVSAPSSTATSG